MGYVSLASSECIEWFHIIIITKLFKDSYICHLKAIDISTCLYLIIDLTLYIVYFVCFIFHKKANRVISIS